MRSVGLLLSLWQLCVPLCVLLPALVLLLLVVMVGSGAAVVVLLPPPLPLLVLTMIWPGGRRQAA